MGDKNDADDDDDDELRIPHSVLFHNSANTNEVSTLLPNIITTAAQPNNQFSLSDNGNVLLATIDIKCASVFDLT